MIPVQLFQEVAPILDIISNGFMSDDVPQWRLDFDGRLHAGGWVLIVGLEKDGRGNQDFPQARSRHISRTEWEISTCGPSSSIAKPQLEYWTDANRKSKISSPGEIAQAILIEIRKITKAAK